MAPLCHILMGVFNQDKLQLVFQQNILEIMPQSNEKNSCTRVDWISLHSENSCINSHLNQF